MKHRLLSTLLILASGVAGSAFAAQSNIETSPQSPGDSVTVASVTAATDGFVVIHAGNADGKPVVPASIGHAAITAGTQKNVSVPLDRATTSGEKLYIMLHKDTGTQGEYEFGPGSVDVDTPMVSDGKPVVVPVMVE